MPPTVGKKSVPQSISEPILEPIQGTAIVLLQPGSLYLRFGRAADTFPQIIPHCIARGIPNGVTIKNKQQSWLIRPECNVKLANQHYKQALAQAQEYLRYRPTKTQGYRQETTFKELSSKNKYCSQIKTDVKSSKTYTDTTEKPKFFVGDEALHIKPSEEYRVSYPICCGQLNVGQGIGQTVSALQQDLEDIWSYAIEEHLGIPIKDLKHYRAVLLIPDIFDQSHVCTMLNVLLHQLGFSAAFLHQESVCTTFGAGVPSACVVDIGDQKMSVTCVEDGISQEKTRITQKFGGRDITSCFHSLLRRIGLPANAYNLSSPIDALQMQNIKESLCHMDQENFGIFQEYLQIQRPEENIVKYQLQIGDEMILAPMGVFCPDMYNIVGATQKLYKTGHTSVCQPDDPNDDDYIAQTRSRSEDAAKPGRKKLTDIQDSTVTSTPDGTIEESILDIDDDTSEMPEGEGTAGTITKATGQNTDQVGKFDLSEGLLGLDQAILQSINNCENDDMKRRMFSTIIVVGGGLSKYKGAPGWIKYSVWTQMPKEYRYGLETMDVLTHPKEMDPTMVSWKGGAILSCLDTAQELWISQREWTKWGSRMLRERAPFVW